MITIRWTLSLIGFALISSACSAISAVELDNQTSPTTVPNTQGNEPIPPPEPVTSTTTTPHETINDVNEVCSDPFSTDTPRFNPEVWETNFCKHSINYDEILSGGPPRDGIPPIDNPTFENITTANEWIDDREPVIAFIIDNDARAYPLQILTWHEIVNDEVSNIPVAVTFCPLCNTGLVFKRPTIGNEVLTFGTSGNLRYSDLVMWDRQTESWWQQFSGEAIVGDLTGTTLTFLPSTIIAWGDFKAKYPDGQVLSKNTGFNRDYGRNPYAGYDNINENPFLFDGILDDRLRPMERVVGILLDSGQGQAYALEHLTNMQVINDTVNETPIVIFWKPGTASALDTSSIADGNDIGSVGVYEASLNNEILSFKPNNDGTFSDEKTGSTWDIFGQAIDGPLSGTFLKKVAHHDTFWFAWAAFVSPESLIAP